MGTETWLAIGVVASLALNAFLLVLVTKTRGHADDEIKAICKHLGDVEGKNGAINESAPSEGG